MDENLKGELMKALFRFRRLVPGVPPKPDGENGDLDLSEISLMKAIAEGGLRQEGLSAFQEDLYISKPAISQKLGVLERKGYINRELDRNNHRKRLLTLTGKGRKTISVMDRRVDDYFTEIIRRFGEDNVRTLIDLFDRFAAITEDLHKDNYAPAFPEAPGKGSSNEDKGAD
jgi:DNA-binding MarR family transcriptional regulator